MTAADTDTNRETRRQAYLAAMGVTAYFPRFVLPGAPLPRAREPVVDPQEAEVPEPGLTMAKTALEQLLEKAEAEERDWREPWPQQLAHEQDNSAETSLIGELAPAPALAPVPAPEMPLTKAVDSLQEPAQARELRFRLALIPVSPTLSVIEQLPWLGNGQLPVPHLRLLWHILQSLGLTVTPAQLTALPFQWPILSAAGFDKGVGAARAALRAFVEQHIPGADQEHRNSGQEHCLLMLGEGLAQALFAVDQDASLETGILLSLPERWQLLTTLSLDQVLRLPALKSTLWRDLRPLR